MRCTTDAVVGAVGDFRANIGVAGVGEVGSEAIGVEKVANGAVGVSGVSAVERVVAIEDAEEGVSEATAAVVRGLSK